MRPLFHGFLSYKETMNTNENKHKTQKGCRCDIKDISALTPHSLHVLLSKDSDITNVTSRTCNDWGVMCWYPVGTIIQFDSPFWVISLWFSPRFRTPGQVRLWDTLPRRHSLEKQVHVNHLGARGSWNVRKFFKINFNLFFYGHVLCHNFSHPRFIK